MAQIPAALASVVLSFLIALGATAANAEAQGQTIPLPPDIESDLALLGEGVVGKPVPVPPLKDVKKLLNIGPGVWKYNIVAGGKDGAKVRTETYTEIEVTNVSAPLVYHSHTKIAKVTSELPTR